MDVVGPPMNLTRRTVSTDDALQLIANRQRRKILRSLHEGDQPAIPLPVLVGELTDADTPSTHHSIGHESQTLVALTHDHLPKLDAYGVVSFDRSENVVAPGPEFDAVEPVLRLLESHTEALPTGYSSEQAGIGGNRPR